MKELIEELLKLGFKPYQNGYARLKGEWGIEFYFPESRTLVLKNLLGTCSKYEDVDSLEKVGKAMTDFYNNKKE